MADWLERHSRPCFYKKYFGIECFGCGFQRATIELLRGNVIESIKLYPALIPILLTVSLLILHLKFKFNHGALMLKILFISDIVLIIGNYIIKLIQI